MRLIYPSFVTGRGAFGLLLVRLVMGAALILHGEPKIHDALHWMDLRDAPSKVPPALQAVAAWSEFGGGLALLLGVLTPLAALSIAGTMAGAIYIVHFQRADPFVVQAREPAFELATLYLASFELAAVYFANAILLLLLGPGILSIDGFLFHRRPALPKTLIDQPAPKKL
jgi:putative oxidoreductase